MQSLRGRIDALETAVRDLENDQTAKFESERKELNETIKKQQKELNSLKQQVEARPLSLSIFIYIYIYMCVCVCVYTFLPVFNTQKRVRLPHLLSLKALSSCCRVVVCRSNKLKKQTHVAVQSCEIQIS